MEKFFVIVFHFWKYDNDFEASVKAIVEASNWQEAVEKWCATKGHRIDDIEFCERTKAFWFTTESGKSYYDVTEKTIIR